MDEAKSGEWSRSTNFSTLCMIGIKCGRGGTNGRKYPNSRNRAVAPQCNKATVISSPSPRRPAFRNLHAIKTCFTFVLTRWHFRLNLVRLTNVEEIDEFAQCRFPFHAKPFFDCFSTILYIPHRTLLSTMCRKYRRYFPNSTSSGDAKSMMRTILRTSDSAPILTMES